MPDNFTSFHAYRYGRCKRGYGPNSLSNLYNYWPSWAYDTQESIPRRQNFSKQYTVKVTELSKVTTEEKLAAEFGQVSRTARVLSVRINNGGDAFNWGYVNYSCHSDAQLAVQLYNGTKIDGHKIQVKMRDSFPHSQTPYVRSSGHPQASSSRYLQNPWPTLTPTGFQSTPISTDCSTIKVTMQPGSLSTHDLEKVFHEFETSKNTCTPMFLKETPNLAYVNFLRPKDAWHACTLDGREFKDVQLHVSLCTKRDGHTEHTASVHLHKRNKRIVCDSLLAKLILSRIGRFREQLDCFTQSSVFSIIIEPMKSGNGMILTGNPEQLEVVEEFIKELAAKLKVKLKEEYFTLQCKMIPLFGKQEIATTFAAIEEKFGVEFYVITNDTKRSIPVKVFASLVSEELFSKSDKTPKISSLPMYLSTPNFRTTEDLWFWQIDDGSFTPYSPDVCAKLNKQFKLTPNSSFSCEILTEMGTIKYTIDFSSMTQMNEGTGRPRSIQRKPGVVQWHYENEEGEFIPFSSKGSEKIEKIKDSTEPSILVIDGTISVFDFFRMRRIDEKTKKECAIHRKITPKPSDGLCICFSINGLPEDILTATECLKSELGKAIVRTEISLPPPSEETEEINTALLKTARQYFVFAEIVKGELQLEGVEGYVEKVQIKIMEEKHAYEKISQGRALAKIDELQPEHWEPQKKR